MISTFSCDHSICEALPLVCSISVSVQKILPKLLWPIYVWPLTLKDDLDLYVTNQNVQLDEIHMHAYYEVCTCTSSIVMANVKVGHNDP